MRPKIEYRLGIKAPASVVWRLLTDLPSWSAWNPLYPSAKGVVGFGELLTLTLAVPGARARTIRPRIVDWAPNEAIHWRASALMGLVQITRYLEVEKMTDTGCIFSNGEIYDGLLAGFYRKRMRRKLSAAFQALGDTLRDTAEGRWRTEGGGTT